LRLPLFSAPIGGAIGSALQKALVHQLATQQEVVVKGSPAAGRLSLISL